MITLIIESADPNTIDQYLTDKYYHQNLVSEVSPENDSIGLPAIKFLIDRAKFSSPVKNQAVFLIRHGHLITVAGQNALLKTLEESRPEEQFIITTHNHHLLLDTILSRCQLISLSTPAAPTPNQSSLTELIGALTHGPAACLTYTELLLADSPAEKLRKIVTTLALANRQLPTQKRIKILRLALLALSDLDRNINPKLALDHFLLKSAELIKNPLVSPSGGT